jgi:hypothetical protein
MGTGQFQDLFEVEQYSPGATDGFFPRILELLFHRRVGIVLAHENERQDRSG